MSKRILMGFIGAVAFALTLGLASVSQAGPIAVCGDGMIEGAETCEDGNTVDGDGCSSDCIDEICGDGVLENNGVVPDEECDDGNTVDGDGCEGDCTCGPCGDGVQCGTEECDDGNTVDDDACSNTCELTQICGNGIVEAPEACDDGNTVDGDTCSADCLTIIDPIYVPLKDDQKCVNGINKSWAGVIKATNKASGKCMKDVSKGKVTGTFNDCAVGADLGKAFDKTTKTDQKSCVGKVDPLMFGYVGDNTVVNMAASDGVFAAQIDLLGNPANVIPKDMKDDAKCQQEVQKGLIKYVDALASDANKAKKDCLKGKKVTQCQSSGDLATAMENGSLSGKKSTKALAKWDSSVTKKCAAPETIAANFPGACSAATTYADLVNCAADRAECAFCASLNAADGLNIDCAAYSDDPAACATVDLAICGNGAVETGEECDDGNTSDGDGCENDCTITVVVAVCGDGVLEGDEQCDDGNTIDGDGCEANCTTLCGDGVQAGAEQCDDGNTIDGDGCEANCTSLCGDGVVAGDEQCDDGNTIDGDGCEANCTTICGDGIQAGTEACDDGNTVDGDGCENDCTVSP